MKNLLFTILLATLTYGINAQVNPHAIGARLGGGGYGQGAELSYQLGMGESNRLEMDLGWRFGKYDDNGFGNDYSHVVFTIMYHWVWNITDGLNWYAGPGGQAGFWNYKSDIYEDDFTVAVGGQIGLEYDFNELGAPLLLSLDTRPMWGLIGPGNGFGYGGALGIRYTF